MVGLFTSVALGSRPLLLYYTQKKIRLKYLQNLPKLVFYNIYLSINILLPVYFTEKNVRCKQLQ